MYAAVGLIYNIYYTYLQYVKSSNTHVSQSYVRFAISRRSKNTLKVSRIPDYYLSSNKTKRITTQTKKIKIISITREKISKY